MVTVKGIIANLRCLKLINLNCKTYDNYKYRERTPNVLGKGPFSSASMQCNKGFCGRAEEKEINIIEFYKST